MHLNSLSLFVDPSQGSFANVLYTFRAGAITAAASPERDHMDLASPERDHMVAGANGGKFIMSSIVHHHSYAR